MKYYLLGIDFVAINMEKLEFFSCSTSGQHAHAKHITGEEAGKYIEYMTENQVKTPISEKCFTRHFSKAVNMLHNNTPFA